MTARKTVRGSLVEELWRPYLKRVDSRLLRRGRALASQGVVSKLVVKDQTIQCQVKNTGFGRGVYYVSLPCVDWWKPYAGDVATWLNYRPDWLGAFLSQTLDEEFLAFVSETGLRLFPNEKAAERIIEQATCTCHDIESPCKHIVATVCELILDIERNPLRVFEYVGLQADELLDLVHAKTAELMQTSNGSPGPEVVAKESQPPLGILLWPEEYEVLEKNPEDEEFMHLHQMRPVFDQNRLRRLREHYIAVE